MKNQAKQKATKDQNELGNRINILSLTIQNELFNQVGEDSFTLQFKLGKTEEEILIDLVGELSIPTKSLIASPSHFKQSSKQMKNSMLMLSTFTAINGLSIISCQTTEQNGINVSVVLDENHNLLNADTTEYKNDIRIFRQKMDKRIESNSQNLSEIRTKIKEENKESNTDFSTAIFVLELANGYMKIKLEDYKPREVDKWKIFKKEFNKEMFK